MSTITRSTSTIRKPVIANGASKPAAAAPRQGLPTLGGGEATRARPVTPQSGTVRTAPVPPAAESAPAGRDDKLPIARKVESRIRHLIKRWNNIAKMTAGWPWPGLVPGKSDVANPIAVVSKGLVDAALALQEFDDKFVAPKRTGGGGGGKTLATGTIVDVTVKAAPKYTDVLDANEMKGLTVTKIAGRSVVCKTSTGTKVIIPRGHLAVAPPAPPAAPSSKEVVS